jgi:hypothetical protein
MEATPHTTQKPRHTRHRRHTPPERLGNVLLRHQAVPFDIFYPSIYLKQEMLVRALLARSACKLQGKPLGSVNSAYLNKQALFSNLIQQAALIQHC